MDSTKGKHWHDFIFRRKKDFVRLSIKGKNGTIFIKSSRFLSTSVLLVGLENTETRG